MMQRITKRLRGQRNCADKVAAIEAVESTSVSLPPFFPPAAQLSRTLFTEMSTSSRHLRLIPVCVCPKRSFRVSRHLPSFARLNKQNQSMNTRNF